ncbi:MAG: AI-2E family transporter [Chloroflexota bacterium]
MAEERVFGLVVRVTLFLVLVAAGVWFAWEVRGVLVLLLIAIILATGLAPIVDFLSTRPPGSRFPSLPKWLSLLLVYLVLIAGLVLLGFAAIPPLIDEINQLIKQAPEFINQVQRTLQDLAQTYPFLSGLGDQLAAQLKQSVAAIANIPQATAVLGYALSVVNAVVSFVLVLVLTLYLTVDGEAIRRGTLLLLPRGSRPVVIEAIDRSRVKIGSWLVGQILLALIIGLTTFIGLLILGVPFALVLAVVAAIGELIPMVGPILSAIPAVIVAFFVSPVLALLTVALYVLIQQFENHIVVPQVMRRAVDLPPVVVIVALLMGGELLGIVGAILALPIAATASVVVSEYVALREEGETRRTADQSATTGGESPPQTPEGTEGSEGTKK